MHAALSTSQLQLLHHLVLAQIPHPDADPMAVAARGMDAEATREDARTLGWMGMVEVADGYLSITPSGRAAYFESECARLSTRLADVGVFADELERLTPAPAGGAHALRQLAQEAWTIQEAVEYINRRAKGA